MNMPEPCTERPADDIDYLLIVNCLAARAGRCGLPAARCEFEGLAGLAVARAAAYYDPARATCPLRTWLFSQGWRLMISAVRDAVRLRRRSVVAVTFTDLAARRRSDAPAQSEPVFEDHRLPADPEGALRLAELLDALSPDDRDLVRMRIERRTLSEIARHYRLSIEAVRQRLLRLRRRVERLAGPR